MDKEKCRKIWKIYNLYQYLKEKIILITELKTCQILDLRDHIHSLYGQVLTATEEKTYEFLREYRNSQQSIE